MILVALALCLVLGLGQEASTKKVSDGVDLSRPIDINEASAALETLPLRQAVKVDIKPLSEISQELRSRDRGVDRDETRDHGDVRREREMERAVAKERQMERDKERQRERELAAERERARVRERERESISEREREAERGRESRGKSEYERERDIEAKRERDREERRGTSSSFESRRGEFTHHHRPQNNHFVSESELLKQRERDREEEIEREIRKAEHRKHSLLDKSLVRGSYSVQSSGRVIDNRRQDDDRIRQAERERAIQRDRERHEKSHRGDREGNLSQREKDRERHRGGGSERDHHDHRHDDHRFSHEKPPILIIEEVPHDSSNEYRGPGTYPRPIQDSRAPDRHPVLPRPSITNLDRRPGRPEYPSKYDEVHLDILHDHFPHHDHHDDVVKPLPIPPPLPPPLPVPVPVPIPAPDPGLILQQQLGQALLTKHALEAGAITKAAALGVLGAIKAGAAAHLGALGAGAAVSNIKHAVKDKLKTHLKHKVAQTIIGGAAIPAGLQATKVAQTIAAGAAIPAGLHALKVHSQFRGAGHQLSKAREAVLLKLLLLKPYFKHIGPNYIIPPELPDIPIGVHLTPVEVEQLPRIYIDQVPHQDAFAPIHIPELREVLEPPLEAEYVEYILGLPEHVFHTITSMSKREFLVTLFPRLYRDSVRDLDPVEDITSLHIPSDSATSSYSVPPVYQPPEIPEATYHVPSSTPVYTPPRITPHHGSSPKPPPPLYDVPSTPAIAYGPPPITTPKLPPPIVFKSPKPIITTTHRPIITTSHRPIITTTHNPIVTTTFKPAITTTFAPSPPSPSYGPPPQPPTPIYGPPPQPPSPVYGPPATPSELLVVNHVDCHDHDDPHTAVEHHHIHHHVHVADEQHRDPFIVPEPQGVPEVIHVVTQEPPLSTHHISTVNPLIGGVVLPIEHHSIKNTAKPEQRPGIPVTTSTVVVGVGVRPHGSENQFFTPVSSTVHPPFSHITPLFPATTVGTPITSTYAVVPTASTTPSSIPPPKHFTTIRPPLTSVASVLPVTTSSYAEIGPTSPEPPAILTSTYSSIFPLTPTRLIPTTPKPTFITPTHPFPTTSRPTVITTNRPTIITTARPLPTTKRPTIFTTLRSFPSTIRPVIVTTTRPYPTTERPTFITTLGPFTTTRRRPSTTPKPPFVIPSAVPTIPSPFEPATTPVFTVTEIPATTTSSTVFQLNPTVIGNGQFELEDNTRRPLPLESDEIDILENLNIDVSTERLSLLDVGKDLDRHPGTDSNDDIHVLSPFTKRKGNATENNQEHADDDPFGLYTDYMDKILNASPDSNTNVESWTPQNNDDDDPFGLYTDYMDKLLSQSPEPSTHTTNTQRLVTGSSAIYTATTTAPSGGKASHSQVAPPAGPPSLPPVLPQAVNTLRNRRVPTPQLVAGDGVPLPEAQGGLANLQELLAAAAAAETNKGGAPGGSPPRQITAEDLAKLPGYLREAPPCATYPANRSFCLMPQDYPSDLAATLVSKYEKEMQQINELLKQLPSPSVDLTHASKQIPTIDASVECQKEERTVELSWSRDVLGSWFVIMQTPPFAQPVTVTTCSAAARLQGCRPLLQPRPLVAFQPRDPEPRPFVFDFPLPVACVFAGLDPLQRASAVTKVVTPDDQPVTSSPFDSDLDDEHSVTSRLVAHGTDRIVTSLANRPIPQPQVTSRSFPRVPLPRRPDTLPGVPFDNVKAVTEIVQNEAEGKVSRQSEGSRALPAHVFLTSCLSLALLVQR
ncbi:mucin-17-like isoform X4 [Penaeus japonicus]|uniref:mucin-17-like isoform X4 n=1 Tax=Penaeus japonicus TaxID=27405 RepID=UPI001C710BCC|nr:mucin-17-like isoform X4 [Penaeus japonicus]